MPRSLWCQLSAYFSMTQVVMLRVFCTFVVLRGLASVPPNVVVQPRSVRSSTTKRSEPSGSRTRPVGDERCRSRPMLVANRAKNNPPDARMRHISSSIAVNSCSSRAKCRTALQMTASVESSRRNRATRNEPGPAVTSASARRRVGARNESRPHRHPRPARRSRDAGNTEDCVPRRSPRRVRVADGRIDREEVDRTDRYRSRRTPSVVRRTGPSLQRTSADDTALRDTTERRKSDAACTQIIDRQMATFAELCRNRTARCDSHLPEPRMLRDDAEEQQCLVVLLHAVPFDLTHDQLP